MWENIKMAVPGTGYEITEWRDFGTKALRQKCVKKHGKAEGL